MRPAGMRYTGIELELLEDSDMYMFFELAMRGGVSTITKRHCMANLPLIPETYNPDVPMEWISYLDANNLVIYRKL